MKTKMQLFKSYCKKANHSPARSVLIAVFIGVAFSLGLSDCSGRMRDTVGFNPQDVVEAYFQSINDFNASMIKDCVTEKAGQDMINYITNVSKASVLMNQLGHRNAILSFKDWDEAGRPANPSLTFVFGAAGLNIRLAQDEPEPVFLCEYDFGFSEIIEGDTLDDYNVEFKAEHRKERYFLKKDREDWVIYKIEKVENTPLN